MSYLFIVVEKLAKLFRGLLFLARHPEKWLLKWGERGRDGERERERASVHAQHNKCCWSGIVQLLCSFAVKFSKLLYMLIHSVNLHVY